MRFLKTLILLMLLCQASWAQTIRRGIGPEPDSLDIHQAQGLPAIHLLREIREGLVTFDERGRLAPGVAGSWEILDDGLLYRFRLRDDARWSNGDQVLAADFVRAWQLALSPGRAAGNASLLAAVLNSNEILAGKMAPDSLGISASGNKVLEVRLERAQAWFLEMLTHPVTYPLHPDKVNDPRQAVVNGAFLIDRMTPHAMISLVPNRHFHSAATVRLERVDLLPIEDPAAELSRYRAGELDITESIPPGRFTWLSENLPQELRVAPYLGSFWLGYNLERPPFNGNADLRKALSLALDREILVRVILGAGEIPAWSVVPPGLDEYEPFVPGFSSYSQEQRHEEARRLFARSGYGSDEPLRLELRYNTSSQHRRMAVAVAAMWKQVLGVATKLINEEWKVFVNNRNQGVLTQVFRGGWIADYADPASFLDLFRKDGPMNWSAYSNSQYDTLLDQASLLQGQSRVDLLRQAESMLMRDTPLIPLYYYVSRHLVKPGVRGFEDNIRDIHLSRYLEINTETE